MAKELGIDPKTMAMDGHLSGAIYGRVVDLLESLLSRVWGFEMVRATNDFSSGSVVMKKGDKAGFVRLLPTPALPLRQKVVLRWNGIEFAVEVSEFMKSFRVESRVFTAGG